MIDDYPKPHEEEWCDCIPCRNWHMRDLATVLWKENFNYGTVNTIDDLRARGVWPFNQTETVTEMESGYEWPVSIVTPFHRRDSVVNLPRESMRGEK